MENNGDIEMEKIEKPIKPIEIDNSVEEWIKAIEKNVKKNNKQHWANRKEKEEDIKATRNVIINSKFKKDIMKIKNFTEMRCGF